MLINFRVWDVTGRLVRAKMATSETWILSTHWSVMLGFFSYGPMDTGHFTRWDRDHFPPICLFSSLSLVSDVTWTHYYVMGWSSIESFSQSALTEGWPLSFKGILISFVVHMAEMADVFNMCSVASAWTWQISMTGATCGAGDVHVSGRPDMTISIHQCN